MLQERYKEKDAENATATIGSQLRYHNLEVCFGGPVGKPGGQSTGEMMASFLLNADISSLFPYINAVAKRAEMYQDPRFIRFLFESRFCVLYPRAGLVSPVEDRDQALSFMERLIDFLKDLSSNHDQLVPNHRLVKRASVLDILKLLPKTNCKACGHGTCMAFAASLSLKEALPEQCPYLGSPVAEQALYPVYDQEGNLNSTVRIDIDTTRTHSKDRADSRPQKTPSQEPSSVPMPLSPRELEVLRILARGYSNKEISRLLEISPHTVKSHVIHIFNKLGVNDRTQAAVWAARRNLL